MTPYRIAAKQEQPEETKAEKKKINYKHLSLLFLAKIISIIPLAMLDWDL